MSKWKESDTWEKLSTHPWQSNLKRSLRREEFSSPFTSSSGDICFWTLLKHSCSFLGSCIQNDFKMLKTILKCILAVVLFLAIYQPTGEQLLAFGITCHFTLLLTLFFLGYETSHLLALQSTNTTTPVAAGWKSKSNCWRVSIPLKKRQKKASTIVREKDFLIIHDWQSYLKRTLRKDKAKKTCVYNCTFASKRLSLSSLLTVVINFIEILVLIS